MEADGPAELIPTPRAGLLRIASSTWAQWQCPYWQHPATCYWILQHRPDRCAPWISRRPFLANAGPSTPVARTPSKGAPKRPWSFAERADRPQRLPPWVSGHGPMLASTTAASTKPPRVRRRHRALEVGCTVSTPARPTGWAESEQLLGRALGSGTVMRSSWSAVRHHAAGRHQVAVRRHRPAAIPA